MSTTIDSKVVEMRMENSNFEKNAATSIGTLAKLKQSLNLTGASKGLEQVSAAAGKVDMRGLGSAVDTVTTRFSALQVMGVTALANITNQAVNAGKNLVRSLTIAPISDGFSEYEMTLNAVQTTMAGTGKTAAEVEKELKKLDEYADKTVYSTADMLNNLPKFTNAGVELETATKAMIGIANATALAGGDAGKASIAFYNLGQAIGTGYLTRMDYNSINNAGIATMEWKNQMVEAAIASGTLTKAGDDLYVANGKNFSLQQLFIDGLQEQWATTEVMTKVFGDYGDETTEIGKKSYAAAQDIKTFSMMMDSLKATAGTGWKDTWQIMFGGLDEAKEFWTGLSNTISGIITSMADFRNGILEGALGKGFKHLMEPINGIKKTMETISEPIKNVTKTLEDYNKVVDEVIKGDWGNTEKRWNALTEAGYDWITVQNMVNEKLGNSKRRQTDFVIGQEKSAESTKKATETNAEYIASLTKLSDAELEALGLTDKQIAAIRQIKTEADKLGLSVEEFIANIDNIDGRWVVINTFKNAWSGLTTIFLAIGKAWKEVFPPKTVEERAASLYNCIAAVHKLSVKFKDAIGSLDDTDSKANKIFRTFKGVFAVVSLVSDVVGGGLKLAFKAVSAILGYFDLDILDVTAAIGDALVKFREMTDVSKLFSKALDFIIPMLIGAKDAVVSWVDAFMEIPAVQKAISKIKDAFTTLKEMDFKEFGKNIIDGLKNGLGDGAKEVVDKIVNVAKDLIAKFCEILGIHSPSTTFFEFGKNIIQGLVNGIQNGISWLSDAINGIASTCINFFKNIDWGSIFALGISVGMIYFVKKIGDALNVIAGFADALVDITENVSLVVKNFAKLEKAVAFNVRMDGVKTLAVAVAILVGSVVALTLIDQKKMVNAVIVIGILAGILFALAKAMDKLSEASVSIDKNGLELGGVKTGLLAIGASLLLIAATVKIIGSMDPEEAKQGFLGLAGILGGILVVFTAYGLLAKKGATANLEKVGSMLFKMSAAMLLLVVVAKLVAGMEWADMGKAAAGLGGLVAVVALLMVISKIGNAKKIGTMLIQMAGAMALLVLVAKTIVGMEWEEMGKAAVGLLGLSAFIALLMVISKIGNTKKIGDMLLSMAASIAILAIVAKLIVGMEWSEMGKAAIGLLGLSGIIAILVSITKLAGKDAPRIATTLLAISVSIGILAAVCMMLSLMSVEGLVKGLTAVGLLSIFMAGMVAATSGATTCVGNLVVLTIAVAVLAASVAVLSLIDPTKLAGATLAMTVLLGMFAIVLSVGGMATASIGPLIVMTLAVGLIGVILYALAQLPVENTLAAATALSVTLLSLTAALGILTIIGFAAPAAIAGMALLGILIAGLTVVLVALGALSKIPGFKEIIADGGGVLAQLGYALGNFVGSIASGLAAGVTSGLPALATTLSAFMANLTPFIAGMKLVDVSVLAGVGILTAAILALTAANLIAGLTSFLPFTGSFADLGTQLSQFMINALPFMAGIKMVDPASLQGVKALAEAILILTAANVIEGMTSWLTGGNSIGQFGSQLGQLGTDLNTFATNLGTFDEAKVTTVKCAANAIKAMAEAASALPNEGGWAAKILGENSIATFGSYLPKLGTDLASFATNLGTFGEDKVNTITCAANAIKNIAEAADKIPNEGGWAAKIFGDNSIATFGEKLPGLATNLNAFATNLGTFDDATVATVTCAANAIKNIAEAADTIPNEGGWAAKIFGDNSLGSFGKQIAAVGTNLKAFATNLGTFGEDKVATVNAAVKAIKALAKLADADLKGAKKNLSGFGDKLGPFGEDLGTFCTNMPSSESITTATNNVKKILTMIDDMSGRDPSILTNFSEKLKKIGKDAVDKFVKAFTSESAKSDVKEAGKKLMDKLIDGVESKETSFKKAVKSVAGEGADAAKEKKSSFESAGKDLGAGLVKGINAKKQAAYDAGYALGQKAVQGEKDGQKSKSPSKLTILAGKWLGEGLVIGIGNMTKAVYNAGHNLGESATDSISNTIARIGDVINSDMDAQPTIRPVLDLSDVSSGVNTLNGMLDMNRTVGLMSNIQSISALANSRQNGNDDILSALNKLNKTMSNLPTGTVNNINGITYSEGNEIADAVNVLVRATAMQGRVN